MKCKALTKAGKPCPFDAVLDGFCIRHWKVHKTNWKYKSKSKHTNNYTDLKDIR